MFAEGKKRLKQNETMITIYIQAAFATLGFGLISPILPLYARSFNVSIVMIGLLLTVVGAVRAILDVPLGKLSDRVGRRPFVILGPAISALGSLIAALAGNYWHLLLARAIYGVGTTICLTALQVMLTDITTAENRGRVMSFYHGAFQVGHSAGPAIGGFLAYYYGIRVPFIAYSIVAVIATFWALWRLKETADTTGIARVKKKDPAGGEKAPHEKKSSIVKQLLSDTSFLLIAALAFLHTMSRTGTNQTILPIIAVENIHINTGQLGIAMSVTSIVHLATIFIGGWMSDRFGRKYALIPGMLISSLGLVVFALSRSYLVFLLAAFAVGLGRGFAGSFIAYAADLAPENHYGSTLGLYHTFQDLGMVVGPILMGWVAEQIGLSAPFYISAAAISIFVVFFGFFARETSGRAVRPRA
ncbi:MAG: MFS transporter [Desulfobacterales bacterium]|nr:MFS transporter [Desulfobacterales bacterium]